MGLMLTEFWVLTGYGWGRALMTWAMNRWVPDTPFMCPGCSSRRCGIRYRRGFWRCRDRWHELGVDRQSAFMMSRGYPPSWSPVDWWIGPEHGFRMDEVPDVTFVGCSAYAVRSGPPER